VNGPAHGVVETAWVEVVTFSWEEVSGEKLSSF